MKTLLHAGTRAVLAAGLAFNAWGQPEEPTPTVAPVPAVAPRAVTVSMDSATGTATTASAVSTTAMLIRQQHDAVKQQRDAAVQAEKATENAYNVLAKVHAGAPAHLERALVIRASKTDPKTIAAMEEDLRVMSRILHKALHETGDDGQQRAMGISMYSVTDGGRARNIQIEGFGAIFMLHVNFPLVGPEAKPEENAAKEPTNSTWEEARREIYGHAETRYATPTLTSFTSRVKFDPKRVEKLKDSLLEALKNAANIRHLTPDESVTLVVNSGDSGSDWEDATASFQIWEKLYSPSGGKEESSGQNGTPQVYEWKTEQSNQATMTIRAKKTDIDAFAKGKITPEEFRKKASVLIY